MSSSGAYTGASVIFSFSLDQSNTVVPTDYKRIGAVRSKSFGVEWDTVDVTADDSPSQTKENLVTFKSFDPTLSGVSRQEESKNLDELEDYVINPVNGQSCGWVRVERPSKNSTTKTYDIPVIFTNFKFTSSYDAPTEWNMDSISNGAVTITYV